MENVHTAKLHHRPNAEKNEIGGTNKKTFIYFAYGPLSYLFCFAEAFRGCNTSCAQATL